MAIDHDRVESIFNAAIAMGSVAERAGYLDIACAHDIGLRERVEALLAAHDGAESFLARPPAPAAISTAGFPTAPLAEGPGARIGRYKLLQLIGEGGFGTVFMAEQEYPVRRKVALKIIKLGMDTRQVIARFEAERQALAMMDHPNIARVFDAGATDTGRPYFVMELVRGVPITEYCDTNNLPTRERLALFLPVCHAVQHAHLKGIIHRDIKPSNILVTMADGSPIPKVIDFGIAKATSARLTEMTLFTEFRQLVGTPEYMSPEQAEMSGIDVDTRTDVYSLGVLLYELLTGTTPFDARELRSKAYAEIQRMIREVEPPRPSTRLSALGATLAAVAAHRRIEPRKLGQLMRGELDCIVMKAMEKDRTRRYETASGLAMDVKRYLEDEPVSARPASAAYRLRKFASKHMVGFAATAAVAAALVLGIIGTSAGLVRARSARRAAEQEAKKAIQAEQSANEQRALAERQADRATAVSGFLQSVLASARPGVVGGGPDAKVVDLLQWAESQVEKELAHDPDAQIQTYYTLYFTYCSLGLMPEALANLRRAYPLVEQFGKEETEMGVRTAIHIARMGHPSVATLDARQRVARIAAERAQRLFGEQHEITVFAHGVLAQMCRDVGKTAEADANYQRLEHGVRQLKTGGLPEPAVAATLTDYAWELHRRGEFARAETHFREALKIASAAKHRVPPLEVRAWGGVADALRSQEKWSEVPEVYERALADLRPRLGDLPLGEMITQYALVLRRLGRAEDAGRVERQLMAALEAIAAAPAHTPAALIRRAERRARAGQFKESLADCAQAIELDPTLHMAWYYRGCLLAHLGDEPAYRAHCAAMLEKFGGVASPARDGERTAKTCILLPGAPDSARLNTIMDGYTKVDTGDMLAWDQLAKSMAQYRAGRFDECIRWAGDAAGGLQSHNDAGKATAGVFAAMAHHRLGRHEQARRELDDVVRWAEQELPKAGAGDIGRYAIENWLILHVALREAEALIGAKPPATRRSTVGAGHAPPFAWNQRRGMPRPYPD